MRYVYLVLAFVAVMVVSLAGFRGATFTKPPLEIFPDMDRQPKYKAQSRSEFFADGRTDRPLPANVVARGHLDAADPVHRGRLADGSFVATIPASVAVNFELLDRGRNRYAIYCQPCHGALGDGKGVVASYSSTSTGSMAPPSFHDDRLRKMADGEIFNTITNGKNTMMPYGDKLAAQDRWAVVAYLRALQRAQNGRIQDVPQAAKAQLGLK